MKVEVLYFDGCPAWQNALENVKAALGGRQPVRLLKIDTLEQARAEHFPGSPTIRVDGRDLFPARNAQPALACRMYATPVGAAGAPTVEMIQRAVGQVRPAQPKRLWLDWLAVVIALLAVLNITPFLGPIFMKIGWPGAAGVVYFTYSFLCHQMAQRSFFLFGPQGFQMYGIDQLPVNSTGPYAILALRDFIGNAALGWKVAWSDRMVSMYSSPLLAALVYAVARRFRAIKPLPLWAFVLFLVPMALDGGTHWLSDLSGIGQGFRDSNAWLAVITGHAFPAWFYSGDSLGSFNSWMRLLTGVSFGVGLSWLVYPYLDLSVSELQPVEARAAGD